MSDLIAIFKARSLNYNLSDYNNSLHIAKYSKQSDEQMSLLKVSMSVLKSVILEQTKHSTTSYDKLQKLLAEEKEYLVEREEAWSKLIKSISNIEEQIVELQELSRLLHKEADLVEEAKNNSKLELVELQICLDTLTTPSE